MSRNSYTTRQTEQYLQLWIYFLPIVGIIPAIWTLSQSKDETSGAIADSQNNPFKNSSELLQQLKASRLSLNLTLIWLSSYILFSWGAADGTQIMAFRFLYVNAIITTSYFVTCTFLMTRLGKKRLFTAD
jgi:phosphate/sulfate permease